MASEETQLVASPPPPPPPTPTPTPQLPLQNYSNRVAMKAISGRNDRGLGLVGSRVVIGGWVRSSRLIPKGIPPLEQPELPKDHSCMEVFQTKIPFLRSIMHVFVGSSYQPQREKEEQPPSPPRPKTVFLRVTDGSCVSSLLVSVESSLAFPAQIMATGTCIVAEGVLQKTSTPGKHVIELVAEKILHIGTVNPPTYPLTRKRIPLAYLRDFPHFRPRTNTVACAMRIRSALIVATHRFLHHHGFFHVEAPILTSMDTATDGSHNKIQATTLFGESAHNEHPKATNNIDGVGSDTLKAAVKEKTAFIEQLKRTESNREALTVALQDLHKINQLVSQMEVKDQKPALSREDIFSSPTYLTDSGRFHLQSYSSALGSVYSFGPRFRAEMAETPRQVVEMWMVELEIAFSQLENAMDCATDFLKFLFKSALSSCSEDLQFISERARSISISRMQSIITNPFEKICYDEAVDQLKKVTGKMLESKIEWGVDLNEEQLSYLADEVYKTPVIIYNYPKGVMPFNARLNDDEKTVAAFDIVVPKAGRLIRGSQNEERIDVLYRRIKDLGLRKEQYEWYLDLRRHGTVETSGFTLAFDLVLLVATGFTDVRDVIPFPRSRGRILN